MEKISYLVDHAEIHNGKNWIKIVGNYWEGNEAKAIILIHMMPATKESWNEFAGKLNEKGWHVLAIDLRGHGESIEYKIDDTGETQKLDYKKFSNADHRASIRDVESARMWLETKGIATRNIYIGGASVGANLTLQYLGEHSEAPAGFLLSPGLDYKGLKPDEIITLLKDSQRIYLLAAEDDSYSADSVKALNKIGEVKKFLKVYESGGHGTNLFAAHPELMNELVEWLESYSPE